MGRGHAVNRQQGRTVPLLSSGRYVIYHNYSFSRVALFCRLLSCTDRSTYSYTCIYFTPDCIVPVLYQPSLVPGWLQPVTKWQPRSSNDFLNGNIYKVTMKVTVNSPKYWKVIAVHTLSVWPSCWCHRSHLFITFTQVEFNNNTGKIISLFYKVWSTHAHCFKMSP